MAVRGWEENVLNRMSLGYDSHFSSPPSPIPLGNTGRLEGLELGECLPPVWVGSGKIIFPGEWSFAKENDMSAFHNDNFPTPPARAVREFGGGGGGGGSWR